MGARKIILAVLLSAGAIVAAADVEISSYNDGNLEFTVKGSGTASLTAQADFKYVSSKTGVDALARATSAPLKVKMSDAPVPVKIVFNPPDGTVTEVEIVVFVDGAEKARRTFGF